MDDVHLMIVKNEPLKWEWHSKVIMVTTGLLRKLQKWHIKGGYPYV